MRKTLFTIIGVLLLTSNLALAAIPNVINYQGRLTDTGGNPYADGNYSMTLTLYNDPVASEPGNVVGSEVHSVTTKNGYFNIQIGSTGSPTMNLSGYTFNEEYYLGIKVNPDIEMTPRKKITSVGYAFRAEKATLADNATTAVTATNASNAVNAANAYKLEGISAAGFITKNSGSVSSADIAAGAVDTQSKAPWAPKVAMDSGVQLTNPKIVVGNGQTDVAGWLAVDISVHGFTSVPYVIATAKEGDANPTIITVVGSSTKDVLHFRSWYEYSDDHQCVGPRDFSWMAIGK